MRRRLLFAAGGLALFVVGAVLGAVGGSQTETITTTETTVETTTQVETETVTRTVLRSPPSSGVKVSYGEWPGLFRIHGARVEPDELGFGDGTVIGQFEYLGGADCEIGYIAVEATFFDARGRIVGDGLWNTDSAPVDVRIPMSVSGSVSAPATRAEVVVTSADCE